MKKRNILILGGTSYFGKHLINLLLQQGDNVCVVTRGNNLVPRYCSHIKFDRSGKNKLILNTQWDVTYDQSCYKSSYLKNIKNIILQSNQYIFTSSQALYPSGENICEDLIDFEKIEKNNINNYGFEKVKSENIIRKLSNSFIFARFPVIVGKNDPRRRIQEIAEKVKNGLIEIPINNPKFQILDEEDAAKILFDLPYKNINGAINFASEQTLSAMQLCRHISNYFHIKPKIKLRNNYTFGDFDLIKKKTKTMCLSKQKSLLIKIKSVDEIIDKIFSNK